MNLEFKLQDKQEVAFLSPATEICYGGAAGGGKAAPIYSRIPTPNGWATLGTIKPGDKVFSEAGEICSVTTVFPIIENPEAYKFTFDDNSEQISCADHQWLTFDTSELAALTRLEDSWRKKRKDRRPSRTKGNKSEKFQAAISLRNSQRAYQYKDSPRGSIRTTKQIAETLRRGNRTNHAIPVAKALQLPEIQLLLDPYTLGAWLGDGSKNGGGFAGIDPEIWQEFEKLGLIVTHSKTKKEVHYIRRISGSLKQLGVLNNKHIPAQYLRASIPQRLALLQGLMDTDGTVCSSGAVEFTNTNREIIEGVYELIVSLGWKATIREGRAKLKGKDCGPVWDIKWTPDDYVFRLSRKRNKQKLSTRRTTKFRYIIKCERVESVPMRCIQVDSPSRLFLIGRSMIPTHNSHLMRVCAIYWCLRVPNFQAYFFRRHYEDLVKNHMGGPNGFRMMLAPLVESGDVTIVEKEIRFNKNNSKIFLCHCNDADDVFQYWGAEIHALFPDELTHFEERMYRFLRSRCRAVGLQVPEDLKGKFPCILAGTNPGNIGHNWVRNTFIDPAEPMQIWRAPKEEGGMLRQFIPARLEDNPALVNEDPDYENKLHGLGSEAYVKAIRYGSWDIFEGAFFTEFDRHKHVLPNFTPPIHWKRFRSFDWGYAKPFCVHWWAISDGDAVTMPDGSQRAFPRNAIICYREWYGMLSTNVGLRLPPEAIAAGIKEREKGEKFVYSVADPSIFKEDGGPSIGERLGAYGIVFRPGDNKRIGGWSEVRARLSANPPMIYFTQNCLSLIRTMPIMQHDDVRAEDLDTDHEDHAVDSVRYACTSRPFTPKKQKNPQKERFTLDELVKFDKQSKRREFRRKLNCY